MADAFGHRACIVDPDIGAFIGRKNQGLGALDTARRDLPAIDEQCGHTALAHTATVVGEIELHCRLAGWHGFRAFH